MDDNFSAPYAQHALKFAETVVRGEFGHAHAMLSSALRASVVPEQLRAAYEEMIEYGDGPPTRVQLAGAWESWSWPEQQPDDLGSVYVGIEGAGYSEGITVIVAKENDDLVIRDLEWGRL